MQVYITPPKLLNFSVFVCGNLKKFIEIQGTEVMWYFLTQHIQLWVIVHRDRSKNIFRWWNNKNINETGKSKGNSIKIYRLMKVVTPKHIKHLRSHYISIFIEPADDESLNDPQESYFFITIHSSIQLQHDAADKYKK